MLMRFLGNYHLDVCILEKMEFIFPQNHYVRNFINYDCARIILIIINRRFKRIIRINLDLMEMREKIRFFPD